MLHQHKRHAGIDGQCVEHLGERLKPAGRGADAHHRKGSASCRRDGFAREFLCRVRLSPLRWGRCGWNSISLWRSVVVLGGHIEYAAQAMEPAASSARRFMPGLDFKCVRHRILTQRGQESTEHYPTSFFAQKRGWRARVAIHRLIRSRFADLEE